MRLPFQQRLGLLPQLLHQLSKRQHWSAFGSPLSSQHYSSDASNFMNKQYIDVSEEVRCALFEGKPVVTLETAILTHGMPSPTNVETALRVQEIVRENGAVPATIGIVKGRIKVGLDDDTLIHLGTVKTDTLKTSYRDLPYVLSQKFNGGTTVSTTLTVSKAVGVPIMVTGGIGGVHRGGETTMDVSADLVELGCTPVGVVCSGVKSILDIERTLEYLETQGVMVATFGPTKDFPAFYSRESGHLSPYNVRTTEEAAGLIHVMRNSRLRSGIVIAVPVPQESAIPSDEMEEIIKAAVSKANESGIRGKEITPYVLSHVAKSTAGRSLSTNVALIQNNAAVGAKIAVNLAQKKVERLNTNAPDGSTKKKPDVMVIGAAVVDIITKLSEPFKPDGRSHRAQIVQSGGGVGRNMADALARLGSKPLLLSAVGDDLAGRFILKDTLAHLDTTAVEVVAGGRTAAYTLLLSSTGECQTGAGDMDVHDLISADMVEQHKVSLASSSLVVLDGNVSSETIVYVLQQCQQIGVPVWFEPTDIHKAAKPFHSNSWRMIDILSPNFNELRIMCKAAGMPETPNVAELSDEEVVGKAKEMALFLAEHVKIVIATLGHRGIVICRRGTADQPIFNPGSKGGSRKLSAPSTTHPQVRYYPAPSCQPVSVSGAGDCWNAGFISAALQGNEESACVAAGFNAALCSLAVASAVPTNIQINLS